MKQFINLIIIQLLLTAAAYGQATSGLPRIAIAGLAIESSTFSPAVTQEEAFHARVGDNVFTFYPFLSENAPQRKRAQWFPTLRGHALPGGIVSREAYESLVNKTLKMQIGRASSRERGGIEGHA